MIFGSVFPQGLSVRWLDYCEEVLEKIQLKGILESYVTR